MTKLIIGMVTKFGLGFLLIGAFLFVCAGSLDYWRGWAFVLTLAVPMVIFGVVLLVKDPAALERRMASREPDRGQRDNILMSAVIFIAAFALAGLDYRFGWSNMPLPVSIIALIVMLGGYGMFAAAPFL